MAVKMQFVNWIKTSFDGGSWLGCQVLPAISAVSVLELAANIVEAPVCLRHPASADRHSGLYIVIHILRVSSYVNFYGQNRDIITYVYLKYIHFYLMQLSSSLIWFRVLRNHNFFSSKKKIIPCVPRLEL